MTIPVVYSNMTIPVVYCTRDFSPLPPPYQKQDNVQVGDLNPTPPPPVEPPPPVVAGGGSEYKNPAADFLVARMGWLSDLSTPPKNLI